MRVFENTTYPLVGLGLVDIDVDEHDLYVFENMSYPLDLWDFTWMTLSTSMGMTWGASDISVSFPTDFS